MISLDKLPKIIELQEFGGNYSSYIDAVYEIFHNDFIKNKTHFGSHELKMKFNPIFQNRAYTFYHMTHEGEVEDDRLPDLRRCERIGWAKPCIENVATWNLRFWRQTRKNSRNRVCILLDVSDDYDYFVVLEVREDYVLLWTAFVATYSHETQRKLKEYETWKKSEGEDISTPDELVAIIQSDIKSKRRQ
ncbi:MAG: hypothetical protein J6B65_04150 [Paludibacteraceae bacterium]|nr:hypothetical protein [Paludibacteraceae bacterium]